MTTNLSSSSAAASSASASSTTSEEAEEEQRVRTDLLFFFQRTDTGMWWPVRVAKLDELDGELRNAKNDDNQVLCLFGLPAKER